MTKSVKVPDPVHERAKEIKETHDYASLGEAVRHMCREGGYDV
ncbi:ribbon-helix-helix domain-containing protein [Natrinema thermotolerans]|nr:ribbon-helix-helix domain-containing protein [Natrinema thermotolerans]